MTRDLTINRFYVLDGKTYQYLGVIQGIWVFEDEGGNYSSFLSEPRWEHTD